VALLAQAKSAMTICFDPQRRRTLDDQTGEYLERERYHYQDPLQHFAVRDRDGECLVIADVAERRIDTTGDKTVDLIEAAVFRVFARRFYDGKMTRVWSRWHPAARRFAEFYRIHAPNLQAIPPTVILSWKLWSALPESVR
jgi:hypothetical protein